MKKMLKEDFLRFMLFAIVAFLATIFVSYIEKNEALSIVTKAFLFIIPILNFLKNRENFRAYGPKLTLIKEGLVLFLGLVTCFAVSCFNDYRFIGEINYSGVCVDTLVYLTETLALTILLYIRTRYRQVGFVLLLIVATLTFVLISRSEEYYFFIYIFYALINIGLIFEIYIMTKHYYQDNNDK